MKTSKTVKPAEFVLVAPDTGLTQVQRVQAQELSDKFPQIAIAYKKVKEQENNLRGKWFSFCDLLREPSKSAKLNGREMTLLLLSLGERKQRATEIIKAISVDDDVWAKYKANVIGFKAILQIARHGEAESPAGSAEAENDTETPPAPEKDKPVIKTLPKVLQDMLAEYLGANVAIMEPTGKGYYEFSYASTVNGHGRKFTVAIEVDDVAAK